MSLINDLSTEEKLLKCPLCLGVYDQPRCIPCGHSLCIDCLRNLVQQNTHPATSKILTCVLCGHISPISDLGINGYPPNIPLQRLCEYLTETATSESLEDAAEVMFCDEHDQQLIGQFCLVCRKLICSECEASAGHSGHAIASLNDGDNRAEVYRRVMEGWVEDLTIARDKLEVNLVKLANIRSCIASTEKGFRSLESNVMNTLQEIFQRREIMFQQHYRNAEVGYIEENQLLSTKVRLIEMFLKKLTLKNEKLSEIHHALSTLSAISNSAPVLADVQDSYLLKLKEELNVVLDECIQHFREMKSFPGKEIDQPEKVSMASSTFLTDTAEPNTIRSDANTCSCGASSPISDDQFPFSKILAKLPSEESGENEHNSRFPDSPTKNDMEVSFELDGNTGLKYYVGIDDLLDIKNVSDGENSSDTIQSGDKMAEVSDDSLPEVTFLSSLNSGQPMNKSEVTLISTFGSKGKENGEFNQPEGLAVSNSGNIFVADSCNNRIQVFNHNFEFLFTFGKHRPSLRTPLGITIHPFRNAVVVTDSYNNRLQFFSERGEFLEKFGSKGRLSAGSFLVPNSVAVNSKGHVIVTDTRNNRIQIVTPEGKKGGLILGNESSESHAFRYPTGVTVDKNDNIVVADYGNNRIQVLSQSGKFLYSFGEGILSMPSNVAVSSRGNIFVSDFGNSQIKIFDGSGNFLDGFGAEGTRSGLFKGPGGIAWLPAGQLVVSDNFCCKLRLFHCPY